MNPEIEALHQRIQAESAFVESVLNEAQKVIVGQKQMVERVLIGLLTGALPNLFTEADEKLLAEKIQTNSVREFLTVMRRKLAGPEGMVLKDVVAADHAQFPRPACAGA